MYFSRSIVASALLAFAAATTHEGEMPGMAAASTSALVASESASAVHSAASSAAAPAASGSAAEGQVATHVVQVGGPNGTTIFSPSNIVAMPGDLVQFQFNPKNHSVVQSTFDQPCVPIQNIMPNKTDAFFSGFMPSNASLVAAGNQLTYTIRVMDMKPIWYYCSQAKHCQSGMVGAINAPPTGNRTLEQFKISAAAAPENLSPGQAPGSGSAGGSAAPSGAAPPSGESGAGGATGTSGGAATSSSADNPAQQTTSAAGRISQSFLGLALSALAAFVLL